MSDIEKQAARVKAARDATDIATKNKIEAFKAYQDAEVAERDSQKRLSWEYRGLSGVIEFGLTFEEVHREELFTAQLPAYPGVGEWPTSKPGRFILGTRTASGENLFEVYDGAAKREAAVASLLCRGEPRPHSEILRDAIAQSPPVDTVSQ